MNMVKSVTESADIAAANALSDAIETWNAKTETRNSLKSDDVAAMEKIRVASRRFVESRSLARGSANERFPGLEESDRERVMEIAADVARYLELPVAMQAVVIAGTRVEPTPAMRIEGAGAVVVGGQTLETPAIESPAVRTHIYRVGNAIVDKLDDYITNREATIAQFLQQAKANDEALAMARKLPVIGLMLEALDVIYDGMDRKPDEFAWRHAANAMVPALAEALSLPPVETKLKGITVNDLVETIERQRNARVAA